MKRCFSGIGLIVVSVLLSADSQAQQVSADQQAELAKIGHAFTQQGVLLEGMMGGKFAELAIELKREGRLDTDETAREASDRVNAMLKEISALYGLLVKNKVEFFLKSKDILTPAQRQHLLAQLKPQVSIPFESVPFMQPDVFDLPINLNRDQRRKLIQLEADLMIKEVELERDVELVLLDLEAVLMGGTLSPGQADPLVKKLGTLAAKELDNRVEYFIKAKDVLTLDQKRMMVYLMELD